VAVMLTSDERKVVASIERQNRRHLREGSPSAIFVQAHTWVPQLLCLVKRLDRELRKQPK
jgi:hypothetical protein